MNAQPATCVFCAIVAGRLEASVVHADDRCVAFMDVQPINPGQCLVIPRTHVDHFTDLADDLAAHVMTIGQRIGRALRDLVTPLRIGFVVAGFGVAHAHLIVVPQHRDDDITSARYASVEGGALRFDHHGCAKVPRTDLDAMARRLASRCCPTTPALS